MTNLIKNQVINSEVELTQYVPRNQAPPATSDLVCSGDYYIKCEVSAQIPKNLHIVSIKLKIQKLGGTKTSFYTTNIIGDLIEDRGFLEEAGVKDNQDNNYQYIDITTMMYDSNGETRTFVIKPTNLYSEFTCKNSATVVIDAIEDKYHISERSLVTHSLGYVNEYTYDPLFSSFKTTTNLFNLAGGYMPLKLDLIYNKYSTFYTVAQNFKFNYEQVVIKENDKYKYIDAKYNTHIFKKSNIDNKYYDIYQPGLILVEENNMCYITDENCNSMIFDSNGRLTGYIVNQNDSHDSEINIEYSNNRISKVTDDLGRSCTFIYNDRTETNEKSITIKVDGYNDVVLLFEYDDLLNIDVLKSITGTIINSTIDKSISYNYEIIGNNIRLKQIIDPSDDVVEFNYFNSDKLNNIIRYVKKDNVLNMLFKHKIVSKNKTSKIEIYNPITEDDENSTTSSYLALKKIIKYDDEGNITDLHDVVDSQVSNKTKIEKDKYSFKHHSDFSKEVIKFKFNNQEVSYYNANNYHDQVGYLESEHILNYNTMNDLPFQNYMISVIIDFEYFDCQDAENNIIVEFISKENGEDVVLTTIPVAPATGDPIVINKLIQMPKKENMELYFKYTFRKIGLNAIVSAIQFSKEHYFGRYDCVYAPTNGDVHDCNGTEWNELCDVDNISYTLVSSENLNQNKQNIVMTKLDCLLTLNSFLHNSNNGVHNLWINNGKEMIANVKNVYITLKETYSIPLNGFVIAVIDEYDDKVISRIYEYHSQGLNMYTEVDFIDTIYSFSTLEIRDNYNKLLSIHDTKNKVREYEHIYDDGETVIERIRSNKKGDGAIAQKLIYGESYKITNDTLEYISSTIPYPNLSEETSYECKSIIDKQKGVKSKEIYPNNQQVNYLYKTDGKSVNKIYSIIGNDENKNEYIYDKNKISSLSHNNTSFDLTYGQRNEITNVSIHGNNLISNLYKYKYMSNQVDTTYNTGYTQSQIYDIHGRLKEIKNSYGTTTLCNVYSSSSTTDVKNNNIISDNLQESLLKKSYDGYLTTYFFYGKNDYNLEESSDEASDNDSDNDDKTNNLLTKIENDKYCKEITYDVAKRPKSIRLSTPSTEQTSVYSYISGDTYNDHLVSNVIMLFGSNTLTKYNTFDSLDRLTKIEYASGENTYSKAYSYFTGTNYTSNNVQTITYKINNNLLQNETLKYNSLGNIVEILYNNGSKINYTYDNVGRLIREDNSILNKTFVFEYDNGGNIVSKKEYPYTLNELPQNATTTTLFTYDSTYKDKLVKVNGDIIEYGTTNNSLLPLSYKGATFTWNYNNRLTSYKKNANSNLVTYLYNTLGNRVQKSYNESSNIRAVHEYIYDDNTLIKETITRHVMRPDDLTPIPDSMLTPSIIQYLYDDNTIIGFVYNDTPYYYIKDALGNIKYILDGTYNIVAKYEYDAWGNHVVYKKTTSGYTINQDAGFIGNVNPVRYKGYYYDVETNFALISSRYYSPELGRFIQPADVSSLNPQSINGLNLYTYAVNNPIAASYSSFDSTMSEFSVDNNFITFKNFPTSVNFSIFNQTIKGSFKSGLWFGNISLTRLYADWNATAKINLKNGTFKLGVSGNISMINNPGQIGFGTDDLNFSIKGVGDLWTISGMVGIFIDPTENNYFAGVEAEAAVLSGRIGGQLEIFGLQIEGGVSGKVLAIGGKFGIGYKEGEFYYYSGASFLFGWDVYIRIRFDKLFR